MAVKTDINTTAKENSSAGPAMIKARLAVWGWEGVHKQIGW